MSKMLVTNHLKNINLIMKESGSNKEFINIVNNYVDKNNEILFSPIPDKRLIFSDERDRSAIYNLLDIDISSVKESVKRMKGINSDWKIANDPFSVIMVLIVKDAYLRKDTKVMNNAMLYLALSLYSSLQFKFFKYVNYDCMLYTLNNLSNKYLFKKLGSVINVIIHINNTVLDTYENLLKSDEDYDIISLFINLRTRLNGTMKNFMNEYKKNYNSKNYLKHDKDLDDEDTHFERGSVSGKIVQISEKVTLSFISLNPIYELVRLAAEQSYCQPNTLKLALESIRENESEKVKDLVVYILRIYVEEGNSLDEIISKKFLANSLAIYNKSNVKQEKFIKLKEILDYLMNKHCKLYATTTRDNTKATYKKALFMYFVMFIQYVMRG